MNLTFRSATPEDIERDMRPCPGLDEQGIRQWDEESPSWEKGTFHLMEKKWEEL